ncbi:hypothetical protein ACQ4PT_017968 [Festuca glaucescens]
MSFSYWLQSDCLSTLVLQDILHRIHSLMPVQDAACVACVSRGFLRSWRCYSKLVLNDQTLRLTEKKFEERKIYVINKVDKILENHYDNGVKVKTLELDIASCSNIKRSYLDKWLRITVKSGIEELNLEMPLDMKKNYRFPCSILSDEAAASSIQSLRLLACDFHPTSTLGLLRRLTFLNLALVNITEEGLGHLLSKSSALERLEIVGCDGIVFLKIPCTLQHLKFLSVTKCKMLQVVEIGAPKLCSFHFGGTLLEISVKNPLELTHVNLSSFCLSGILSYARTRIPSIARYVESLTLLGRSENASTPMLPSKLPHLKNLEIRLLAPVVGFSPSYDAFSLVSFLDASPALESFILHVEQDAMTHDPVVGEYDECLRQKLGCWHNCLKQVAITGFCSAKSLVELTVHIIESTHSLERLTLDTTYGYDKRVGTIGKCPTSRKIGQCWPMSKRTLEEAHRAVKTAGRYIMGRVPLTVQSEVLEPCSRCHTGNQ